MRNWNLIFRRTHLYLGLVLLPWTLIYALSTIYFNHRPIRHGDGGATPPQWRSLWEKSQTLEIPQGEEQLRETAARLVAENGFGGPFGVQRQGARLVVNVPHFLEPKRLIYDASTQQLKAEVRVNNSTRDIFGRLHTRTGYNRGGLLTKVWAFVVDLFCFATFAWVATGIYLWWKITATRIWGGIALAGGVATITLLLFLV